MDTTPITLATPVPADHLAPARSSLTLELLTAAARRMRRCLRSSSPSRPCLVSALLASALLNAALLAACTSAAVTGGAGAGGGGTAAAVAAAAAAAGGGGGGASAPSRASAARAAAAASPSPKPPCAATQRVLVTGVSGMIGSHVARELVAQPCTRVYGLVRPRSNLDALVGVLNDIELVTGDLADAHRMLDVVAEVKPHVIYHFGAQAINGISYANADLTVDVNVRGTLNLLEGVRRAGLGGFAHPAPTRVLLAGSSTEYGRTVDEFDGAVHEGLPLKPVTPYGVSKVSTELLGNQYNASFGIPVVTARFFIQVGVGGTDSLAIHQFCRQIAMAEAGLTEPVLRHGNLAAKRDMSNVRDTAPVVVQLAQRGVPGEAYNVGSGQSMAISDLLALALASARVPVTAQPEQARLRAYDEKVLLADIGKLQRLLPGWRPNVDMERTVKEIMGYWRARVKQLYLRSGPDDEL